jgi:hypothetical protein
LQENAVHAPTVPCRSCVAREVNMLGNLHAYKARKGGKDVGPEDGTYQLGESAPPQEDDLPAKGPAMLGNRNLECPKNIMILCGGLSLTNSG